MEAHMLQQNQANNHMNLKMDFFNSMLNTTNRNIEVISHQLNQIQ